MIRLKEMNNNSNPKRENDCGEDRKSGPRTIELGERMDGPNYKIRL